MDTEYAHKAHSRWRNKGRAAMSEVTTTVATIVEGTMRMKSRLVNFALAASLSATLPPAQAVEPVLKMDTSATQLAWGDRDISGLELGVWQVPGTMTLLCDIRNQGNDSIRYNLCFLGQQEAISIYARPIGAGEWKRI